jgi:phosphatidate cytidylyltransferase
LLKQRIITGLVLAPLTLACVYFLGAEAFAIFCSIVILIGAWEWGPLMGLTSNINRVVFMVVISIIMALLAVVAPVTAMWGSLDNGLTPLYQNILLVAALWWLVAAFLVYSYPNNSGLWRDNMLVKGLIGVLTLIPAWIAFIAIRTLNIDSEPYFGAHLLFASLSIVWAADVGAYFCGKRFGKHKLMPKVSPNKTLEGFFGGLVCVAVLALLINVAFVSGDSENVFGSVPVLLVIAIVTAIVSAVGDLNESMLKRAAGIKDTGTILPGHGGLLDRIDSLVAATPIFILLYIFLV